jgi:hypothetical protein
MYFIYYIQSVCYHPLNDSSARSRVNKQKADAYRCGSVCYPRTGRSSARVPRTSQRPATRTPAPSGPSGPTGRPAPGPVAAVKSPARGSAPSRHGPAGSAVVSATPTKRLTATRTCVLYGRSGLSGRRVAPPAAAALRGAAANACCLRGWPAAAAVLRTSRGPATVRSVPSGRPGLRGLSARSPAAAARGSRCGSACCQLCGACSSVPARTA